MIMQPAMRQDNMLFMLLAWPVFGSVTIALMMGIDMLECMLHCIRLHWVEFQSKFYKGEGELFRPLNFKHDL